MRILVWLVRAVVFLGLFAFALNNRHSATVFGFFGAQWQAPVVIVVLLSFAAGALLGVLAMLRPAWRHRERTAAIRPPAPPARRDDRAGPVSVAPMSQPPREAL